VKYDPLAFGVGKDDPTVAAAATAMIGTIHMAACVYVCVCVRVWRCAGEGMREFKNVQENAGKMLIPKKSVKSSVSRENV
jgi:hypothetical protein